MPPPALAYTSRTCWYPSAYLLKLCTQKAPYIRQHQNLTKQLKKRKRKKKRKEEKQQNPHRPRSCFGENGDPKKVVALVLLLQLLCYCWWCSVAGSLLQESLLSPSSAVVFLFTFSQGKR
jgi:hypothetical protein